MKAKIVRVGNSLGIRIPKLLIEQTGLTGDVEIEAKGRKLIVRPIDRPRAGWAEAFRDMATQGDEKWDEDEWQWR